MARRATGTLALVGGGEWRDGGRALDASLLEAAGGGEVVVVPTAAAFEEPDRVGARAHEHFAGLGATVRVLDVLHRAEADDAEVGALVAKAKFVYLADGSPLHLRSVLKDSALFEGLVTMFRAGGVLAASGAGATLLCDPMVDPRGGAYTVGLGLVEGLAVFPYHGSAADHLRERSIELLPRGAVLAGVDEETALVHRGGTWTVAGAGAVTIYAGGTASEFRDGATVPGLPVPAAATSR